ncbi:MAG TPA: cytochrome c oxidase assembly protein [Gaiella sp.]
MAPLVATAPGDLWKAWSFDPLVLAGAIVAVAFFAQGWRRLRRRRPELAPWSRWPLFVAGVAIVVLGLVSPLDAIAEEYLQSAHMLQHVLIADLGVALALLAVRGPLSMFFLPRDLLAPLARRHGLRRALSFLLRPRVAVTLWLGVLVAWHLPVLYDAALRHPLVHRAEHLSFVVVGALVWTLLIDPARHGRLSVHGRIGLAVVMLWMGQMLAYVFVFSFHPYYDVYTEQPERLFGLSPLMDQKLAGVVMMAEQALTLGTALVLLLLVARRPREAAVPRATPEPV